MGLKFGTERGIVTTEIWVPVRQAPDRVLYGVTTRKCSECPVRANAPAIQADAALSAS